MLHFYRNLLSLRKQTPALIGGKYRAIDEDQNDYMAYLREGDTQTCFILLNFSEDTATVQHGVESAEVLFSSEGHTGTLNTAGLELEPFEILILNLQHE